MEMVRQEQLVARHLKLLNRRLEMDAAETKLEQAVMEAEIRSMSKKVEALSLQRKIAIARHEAQGHGREAVAILDAELESARQSVEVHERKLEFHATHAAPMRQLEIEMELEEREHELTALHAGIDRMESNATERRESEGEKTPRPER